MISNRLNQNFFSRDIFTVAHELMGKKIARKTSKNRISYYRISEIELYVGEEDLACHASKGRTTRTEIMYHEGGKLYVYLIYGMYWLLNIVTGKENQAQAILIRGIDQIKGPGRAGRTLGIDKSFYGEDLWQSNRIWIEDDGYCGQYEKHPRINIDYAGEIWKNKPFRYTLSEKQI